MQGYTAELRDALALARSLGRGLIPPRFACYCDRLWSGSDDIFQTGCMYPARRHGHLGEYLGCISPRSRLRRVPVGRQLRAV